MFKPKKISKTEWHVVNKEGWTALICEKKSSAKIASRMLNEVDFDSIKTAKVAKAVHNCVQEIAKIYDSVDLF